MAEKEQVRFYISCSPGLESCLSDECARLGLKLPIKGKSTASGINKSTHDEPGGLEFDGDYSDVYRCNLHLRTASRISVRLGEFFAAAFSELRKKASRLNWEAFIVPGQAVNVSVTCHKSRLYHSDAVAERVLGAINDHFGHTHKPIVSSPHGQLILVRLVNDLCTISIDSSGDLLHKRGYRLESAKAPLRETLAAGMILLSGWQNRVPLIDPFCGSGTIPIEAALIATHTPPGIAREFAFSKWPLFEESAWQSILQNARKAIMKNSPTLAGYDRDQGAIRAAESNAARGGTRGMISFTHQPISELKPSAEPGWLITNPPYGVRTNSNRDLRDLYARFGSILRLNFTGWNVGILSSDKRLAGNLGLPAPVSTINLINGGLPVQFLLYHL